MTTRERVALFVPALGTPRGGMGGAERIMLNLAGELRARGYPVDILLAEPGEFLSLVPAGVQVIDLGTRSMARSIVPLAGYLRRTRPAVLLSALDHCNVAAVWARQLSRMPTRVVVANHILLSSYYRHPPNFRTRLQPLFVSLSYRLADAVISVSRGAAEDLAATAHLPLDRIQVIYNPVLTPELYATASRPAQHPWLQSRAHPVILSAGRLTRQKNYDLLLRAFAELRSTMAARLIIYGEGEERTMLQTLARSLGVGDDVDFPGWNTNVHASMARASLFVLSSLWEALPTVLVEALALGLPVVSTDCRSGPGEILGAGRYGALVPVGDQHALARAMQAALCEPPPPVPREALRPYEIAVATDHYIRALGLNAHA